MIDIKLNERESYTLWRRKNKVTLSEISEYVGCTASLLSQWERGLCEISEEKIRKYNEFIKAFDK
ncbi:helix-turn-helix domain-containing protein [Clostridium ganghwense]|uniref:Helix-turn-helix transcriptional regulator n=1 Tax=Clostridium ganghwense TaxID=312089 RepID=A0ABT4CUK0_9CLOT|nr:helix-turn-helix transcriptional regulator [Clostridium ganghwense]MCY6372760.1 helix-turn-helix transcriptional regulator [Clostridium ganghwense]